MPDTPRLKIALASPYDFAVPSGVNQHVRHLSNELMRLGHHVTVIAPQSGSETYGEPIPNFHSFGSVVRIPANGSVAHISISPDLRRRVKDLMAREKFDIVHGHEPLTPALTLAVLRYSRAATVGTFHAYGETSPHYFLARPVLRRFFDRIDGHVAVSELARKFVSRYFGGDYRIIPNGVDTSAFDRDAAPFQHLMDGRPNILFLGRFEEERKGFKYALKTLRRLGQVSPDARLVVVGHGDASKYNGTIRRYGIERNVHFVGAVSDEDRARYMASCRVLMAPNTGGESQGLVVLEALAAGLPVLATKIPAYENVITHGEEGFLVEPENECALAQALQEMLSDSSACRRMAESGKEKAAEYSWPKISAQLVDFYIEVCERKAWHAQREESDVHARSLTRRAKDA